MGSPVAGSPTFFRNSRWPKACPVSASAVSLKRPATSGKPSMSATRAKYRYRRLACDSPAKASFRLSTLLLPFRGFPAMVTSSSVRFRGGGGSGAGPAELRRWAPAPRPAAGAALALGTAAVELDAMMSDAEAALGGHPPAEGPGVRVGRRCHHVADPAAAEAGEVMVLAQVSVEARV